MTDYEKKELVKAQQGELDAVLLYKKLACKMKDTKRKEILIKVASDEGKHASILKNYTNEILRPSNRKAVLVNIIFHILGAKKTFHIISKNELKSLKTYNKLVRNFPEIQSIIDDEIRHSRIADSMF